MGWLIGGVILTITIVLGIGLVNVENNDKFFTPYMLFGLLGLSLIFFGCFGTIHTGEIGIKTRFGKIVGTTSNEGIIWKSPLDTITKINVKVQKYSNDKELDTSTKDMQVVTNIKAVVNYQIDGTKAVDLYKTVGKNYKEIVLEPAIQETIKAIISKYTSEELVTKRSEISQDINNTLNEKLTVYGIKSVSVAINNFDFSSAYNQAIEKKAVAEQEVQTSKNQLEKAKIEAETKKVKAQGDAEANALLEKSLTKEILIEKWIEKWDGSTPKVSGGNNMIDISELLK